MPRHVEHQATEAVLEVAGLTVRYNGLTALEDVSFKLAAGERVAVAGPNGAGKSTLFKALAGLLPAPPGAVRIYGHGPGGHTCIAYVPQRTAVDWSFPASVFDAVMMGRAGRLGLLRRPARRDRALVRECLALVGLADLAGRQVGELSGGQQQRMFIARALAQDAELMLLDEPLNGVDAKSQPDILRLFEELGRRGVTVLVALHDLSLAAARFSRILLLNRVVLGFGSPAEVLTPERLELAYGRHLHLIRTDAGFTVLADTCCEGEAALLGLPPGPAHPPEGGPA